MDIIFRFESAKAQIVLSPTNTIDEANLKTVGLFGDKNVKFRLGVGKEFIIESNGLSEGNGKAQGTT